MPHVAFFAGILWRRVAEWKGKNRHELYLPTAEVNSVASVTWLFCDGYWQREALNILDIVFVIVALLSLSKQSYRCSARVWMVIRRQGQLVMENNPFS